MIASASQHSHFTRTHIFTDVAVLAFFVIGFVLMLSGLGIWLIGSIEPHWASLISTILELASFLFFGIGAHLMDRDEKHEREENFGDKERSQNSGS